MKTLFTLLFAISITIFAQDFSNYIISTPSIFNFESNEVIVYQDIPYKEDHERNKFDLFKPSDTGSYPLIIHIHGGGFTGGDKGDNYTSSSGRETIKMFLDSGFAFASLNYRLIETDINDEDGVQKPLHDCRYALQFIKHYAEEFNIDIHKIVLKGGSAGAGTSLWLNTHPDMADTNSSDSIEHQSTKVCGAFISNAQATYDVNRWAGEVFNDYDIQELVDLLSYQRYNNFYGGIDSIYHPLRDPALIAYRKEVGMLHWMSSDDGPIYNSNAKDNGEISSDPLHHPDHGNTIRNYMIFAGIEGSISNIPSLGIDESNGESGEEFCMRIANAGCSTSSTPNTEIICDTITTTINDTITTVINDTNTINIHDSITIYDTIGIIDSTTILDTTTTTIYDTITTYDTLNIVKYDTVKVNNCDTLFINMNNQATYTENLEQVNISIYPNPSSDELHIDFSKAGDYSLNLYNNLGTLVLMQDITSEEHTINISNLPSGIYQLNLQDNNQILNNEIRSIVIE